VLEWNGPLSIKAPALWEVADRLSSVQAAIENLWQALGITQTPTEVWNNNRSGAIESDALLSLLHDAADKWGREHEPDLHKKMEIPQIGIPDEKGTVGTIATALLGAMNVYSTRRMRDIVDALAMLDGWINTALLQSASEKLTRQRQDSARHRPNHIQLATTCYLAQTYEMVFDHSPTDSKGGPWLSFLKSCLLELTGTHLTTDALRARWRRAKKTAHPRSFNAQDLHANWQKAKQLRALAPR
jgi:hypothetical protein